MAKGVSRRRVITSAVFDELCSLLDPSVKPYKPTKGRPNVIMFVGLQGAGKTTTVTKMANYYKRKGWRACLVCADTFRAGAFDQLKQNATKAGIPYVGSYTEGDPVKIAKDGVKKFKNEGYDIIIVDTSGRHKQEARLFEEMQQVKDAVKPDDIVFVMDGSIGQAAHDQATAFHQAVDVGSVIITKLDGHAKGGGALSAVAATKSPIIFLGTGEHINDLDHFEAKSFVSRLLGMGDVKGMADMIKEAIPLEQQNDMAKQLQQGKFSLRMMNEQFQSMLNMGPLDKVMEKLPGFGNLNLPKGDAGTAKIRAYMTIMDSMTDQELDFPKCLNDKRLKRISMGSGRRMNEVKELLMQYKHFEKVVGKIKGIRQGRQGIQQMASMVPQHVLKQMGGIGGLNSLMRQMNNGGGMDMFK
mmetsp:Transcript_8036/g.8880  ORF Transcript_8036/g.8880 Transcript_8036/m.8880 type:complete len:413 (-) Transcript_8036:101-1339(-)